MGKYKRARFVDPRLLTGAVAALAIAALVIIAWPLLATIAAWLRG